MTEHDRLYISSIVDFILTERNILLYIVQMVPPVLTTFFHSRRFAIPEIPEEIIRK